VTFHNMLTVCGERLLAARSTAKREEHVMNKVYLKRKNIFLTIHWNGVREVLLSDQVVRRQEMVQKCWYTVYKYQ